MIESSKKTMPGVGRNSDAGADGTLPVRAVPAAPSRRIVKIKRDQAVRRLSRKIARECPWLTSIDGLPVGAYAQLERLAMEAYTQLQADGLMRGDGTVHPLVSELAKLRRVQAQLGSQLGIGPKARSEIQSGSRGVPVDAEFEARVSRVHTERHGDADVEE
jgi:hypothetical protein